MADCGYEGDAGGDGEEADAKGDNLLSLLLGSNFLQCFSFEFLRPFNYLLEGTTFPFFAFPVDLAFPVDFAFVVDSAFAIDFAVAVDFALAASSTNLSFLSIILPSISDSMALSCKAPPELAHSLLIELSLVEDMQAGTIKPVQYTSSCILGKSMSSCW